MEPNNQPCGRHRYGSSTCGMRGHLVEEATRFKGMEACCWMMCQCNFLMSAFDRQQVT